MAVARTCFNTWPKVPNLAGRDIFAVALAFALVFAQLSSTSHEAACDHPHSDHLYLYYLYHAHANPHIHEHKDDDRDDDEWCFVTTLSKADDDDILAAKPGRYLGSRGVVGTGRDSVAHVSYASFKVASGLARAPPNSAMHLFSHLKIQLKRI